MLRFIHTLLFALFAVTLWADEVVFASGDDYRIECAGHNQGGFAPGSIDGNPAVLYYYDQSPAASLMLWTIEQAGTSADGSPAYTLRHKSTGLYATYDGLRDVNKRYVKMSTSPEGDASLWVFTDRGTAWSIDNVQHPEHHFHVRSSCLTGTYADDNPPGINSQFRLYTADGRRVTTLTPPLPNLENQMGSFTVGQYRAVYDKSTSTYLVSLPADLRTKHYLTGAIRYDSANGTLFIDEAEVADGADYEFADFVNGNTFALRFACRNGEVFCGVLTFTFMPIIELFGGFSAKTSDGEVRVNDPEKPEEAVLHHMKAHWRGNTSLNRAKKCYALKFTDDDGEKLDVKLLGMRSDNNWILDAAFIDPSRIRNRVSTDIWNDYHCAPYYGEQEPKARTATRGCMVEVFLNGAYDGIYCFTEKLDRKQLKLRKLETTTADGFQLPEPVQHGLLYKAVEWDTTTYFGFDGIGFTDILPWEPLSYNDAWGGWEVKYPDLGDGEPIDWHPLWDHTRFMYLCTDDEFRAEAAERFDLPVLRDYYLLQELAMAFDNSAKNIYWYVYDAAESTKMSLSPWDFDGTWGRVWDGSYGNSYAEWMFRDYYEPRQSNNKIFSLLMRLNVDGWNEQLARRYGELRYSGIFDPDNIYQRFADYFALMRESGATQREYNRWNNADGYQLDFDAELPFLRRWIDTHVAVLDAFYHYDPVVVGIDGARLNPEQTSYAEDAKPEDVRVHAPDGRCVLALPRESGRALESALRALPHGVYIVDGKKIKL